MKIYPNKTALFAGLVLLSFCVNQAFAECKKIFLAQLDAKRVSLTDEDPSFRIIGVPMHRSNEDVMLLVGRKQAGSNERFFVETRSFEGSSKRTAFPIDMVDVDGVILSHDATRLAVWGRDAKGPLLRLYPVIDGDVELGSIEIRQETSDRDFLLSVFLNSHVPAALRGDVQASMMLVKVFPDARVLEAAKNSPSTLYDVMNGGFRLDKLVEDSEGSDDSSNHSAPTAHSPALDVSFSADNQHFLIRTRSHVSVHDVSDGQEIVRWTFGKIKGESHQMGIARFINGGNQIAVIDTPGILVFDLERHYSKLRTSDRKFLNDGESFPDNGTDWKNAIAVSASQQELMLPISVDGSMKYAVVQARPPFTRILTADTTEFASSPNGFIAYMVLDDGHFVEVKDPRNGVRVRIELEQESYFRDIELSFSQDGSHLFIRDGLNIYSVDVWAKLLKELKTPAPAPTPKEP